MKEKKQFPFFLVFLLLLIAGVKHQQAAVNIKTQDIHPQKVILVGPLGFPLGKVLTIKGKVEKYRRRKGKQRFISVLSVEGKRLKKPIRMSYRVFVSRFVGALPTNQPLKLRVYQDGGMAGTPEQAMKETIYMQARSYHFETTLVLVRRVKK